MNRWFYFFIWILTIFAGELGAVLAPENFTYTIGFIVGTFSFMFLRLFTDKKE